VLGFRLYSTRPRPRARVPRRSSHRQPPAVGAVCVVWFASYPPNCYDCLSTARSRAYGRWSAPCTKPHRTRRRYSKIVTSFELQSW